MRNIKVNRLPAARYCRAFLTAIMLGGCVAMASAQTIVPYTKLNSTSEDYAVSFRTTTKGTEVWFTTSRGCAAKRSRHLMYSLSTGNTMGKLELPSAPVNQKTNDPNDVVLDGCPTFAPCGDGTGIFVSNRADSIGRRHGNDLYEVRFSNDTVRDVRRIVDLCSEGWDDCPALSPDGNTIFFASDRLSRGTGRTDVFIAHRDSAGWTTPERVDLIFTEGYSTQSPFVGMDGYLYYATNHTDSGDYDIWRAPLNPLTGRPSAKGIPLDMPGVNLSGSNEGHPVLSPGGKWLVFCSDRNGKNGTKDFDLYMVDQHSVFDTLVVREFLLTQQWDSALQEPVSLRDPHDNKIVLHDNLTGATMEQVPQEGVATFLVPPLNAPDPISDFRFRDFEVHAERDQKINIVSPSDELIYDVVSGHSFSHDLFLVDSSSLVHVDTQNFRKKNIEFFAASYWCPSTKRFQKYLSCTSIERIAEDPCQIPYFQPPLLPCADSNDLFRYRLRFVEPQVIRSDRPCLCLDTIKAVNTFNRFYKSVDLAIESFVTDMEGALQVPAVQHAIARPGAIIRIEIEGWTDTLGFRSDTCKYTGPAINFANSFIKMDSVAFKPYCKNGTVESETVFRRSKQRGNELLSELRAYYTARLLDALWRERVPKYKELCAMPGRLCVVAVGQGVKQDDKLSSEKRRSVSVKVIVPPDTASKGGLAVSLGKAFMLSKSNCSPLFVNRDMQQEYAEKSFR